MNAERANHLMDTATFEAGVFYDKCVVVCAKLEDGTILHAYHVDEDKDNATQECMGKIYAQALAMSEEPLTKEQAEIIVALAECNQNATQAAKKLGISSSTMSNRIKKIREQTGKNPLDFMEMAALLVKANEALNR